MIQFSVLRFVAQHVPYYYYTLLCFMVKAHQKSINELKKHSIFFLCINVSKMAECTNTLDFPPLHLQGVCNEHTQMTRSRRATLLQIWSSTVSLSCIACLQPAETRKTDKAAMTYWKAKSWAPVIWLHSNPSMRGHHLILWHRVFILHTEEEQSVKTSVY